MDVQEQAWRLRQEGKSFGEIARELGISKSTAHKYVRDYNKVKETSTKIGKETSDNTDNTASLSDFLENPSQQIQIVSVDKVIDEINQKITTVEEPQVNVKKKEEERLTTAKNFLSPNKYMLLLTIVAAGVILGVIYLYLRGRRTEPEPEPENEPVKKSEQKEKRKQVVVDPQENTDIIMKKIGIKDGVVL